MKRYFSLRRALALAMLVFSALAALGVAAPALAKDEPTGAVTVDALNLRVGPGLNYQVARILHAPQSLRLLGRSANSEWLEVRLPDGAGGWVYAAYVTSATPLSGLPLTEAAGGPVQTPAPSGEVYSCANTPWDLCMSISGTQATVYLQKYPKNAAVVVWLRLPDGSAEVEAARGTIGADGKAQITFTMPSKWANGRAMTETNMQVVVGTPDKVFTRSATINYAR